MTNNYKRVAVTGLGAITPIGNTVKDFWEGLLANKNGAAPITQFDASVFKTQFACEVKGFDPEVLIPRKECKRLDRFTQLGICSAIEAIEASGILSSGVSPEDISVIWGAGIGGSKTFQDGVLSNADKTKSPRFSPFFIAQIIINIVAGHIAMKYQFRGPNYATVSACASSAHAVMVGASLIQTGQAPIVVVGGSEACVNETVIGGFNASMALSTRNDAPEKASRPFDTDRDGFVMGEGAATLILEDYELAVKRGAHIYCELTGYGASNDAYHLTLPHPEGTGVKLAIRRAIDFAGIDPSEIQLVNGHATATPAGDTAELLAIQQILGEDLGNASIHGMKSSTGHMLGAAGAAEAVATVLSLYHDTVPATLNVDNPESPVLTEEKLPTKGPLKKKIDNAISNGFGFGGHNAVLLFSKAK
ncbi:MAG: beta-ketoacyl-ACP synthase II [Spirochaetales bacterium]|nr:beta-ketoacyl-ACP synthase II [Spirochaetales bacterium]